MENKYTLYLAGFGFPDHCLELSCMNMLTVYRKGELSNYRTGAIYKENIFRYEINVLYEEGFEVACDTIIQELKNNLCLSKLVANCTALELEPIISIADELLVPALHFRVDQLLFLAQHNIEIDISIT